MPALLSDLSSILHLNRPNMMQLNDIKILKNCLLKTNKLRNFYLSLILQVLTKHYLIYMNFKWYQNCEFPSNNFFYYFLSVACIVVLTLSSLLPRVSVDGRNPLPSALLGCIRDIWQLSPLSLLKSFLSQLGHLITITLINWNMRYFLELFFRLIFG